MVGASGHAAIVLLASLAWPAAQSPAQTLKIDTIGDTLKIRAQGFSFLTGDPLDRLKDGQSVRVELTAMVLPAPGQPVVATTRRIFALSYDLWEERFAVTTVEKRSQSVTHLVQPAAEAWCIDQLGIPVNALGTLGRDVPFWIRFEYRILDGEGSTDSEAWEYTIQALIDVLSRRTRSDPPPQAIEAGPFRLSRKIQTPNSGIRATKSSLKVERNTAGAAHVAHGE